MKSRKIFFAVVVLAIILCVVGCSETPDAPEGSKMPSCFQLEPAAKYTNVSTLEGTQVAYNSENNLIALKTYELSRTEGLKAVIKVYDLLTGDVVFNVPSYMLNDDNILGFKLDLSTYPLIQINLERESINSDSSSLYEHLSYAYLINTKEGTNRELANGIKKNISSTTVGNMYLYEIGDTLYWVSQSGMIVREQSIDISDSYSDISVLADYFNYYAEYNGYVYAWEFSELARMLQIYDTNGICAVQYNFPDDTVSVLNDSDYDDCLINPRAFVLNNGDVLVQYCTEVKDAKAPYDFAFQNYNLLLETAIVNHIDGSVKPLDINEVVLELESAYSGKVKSNMFGFKLASGYDNQAYTVSFANGKLSHKVDYKVFDNEMTVKYTFKNDVLGYQSMFRTIRPDSVSGNGYVATYLKDGAQISSYFDYDGNVKADLGDNVTNNTNSFYCTNYGIYKLDGTLAYDLESNGFVPEFDKGMSDVSYLLNGKVFLTKYNPETASIEVYALNSDNWTVTLIANGDNVNFADDGEGYFTVYDSDTDVSSLYNYDNKVILKTRGKMNLYETEDIVYVTVTVGGDDLVYVINSTVQGGETK